MAEGLDLGHSCWEKELNNFEKTLNEEICARGLRSLEKPGGVWTLKNDGNFSGPQFSCPPEMIPIK